MPTTPAFVGSVGISQPAIDLMVKIRLSDCRD